MESSVINGHGADIYSASRIIGLNENSIIDFSSNINPLGVPRGVRDAVIASLEHIDRYPDINSRELVRSISSHENVEEKFVFCANGAAEAIFRIPMYLKPENALITAPAFSEYESALRVVGCNVEFYNLSEEYDFKIKEDFLDFINEETDIVFICNPNNPTGQLTDNVLLEKIIARCEKMGAFVVVDECFIDFTENNKDYSVKHLLGEYSNLIILKAFTKIFAIPGVRLGYCLSSSTEVIEGLKIVGPPWNVSNIAQAAGVSALREKGYIEKTVEYVKEQRAFLCRELSSLGIRVYEGYGNYIFFKFTGKTDLKAEMLKKGILIRSCSNYRNLTHEYYRIAVKTREENKIFIDRLKEIIQ